MSTAPVTVKKSGRWKFRSVAFLALTVAIAGLWWTKSFSYFCNSQSIRAIQLDHIDQALSWLSWSASLRDGNPDTHLWKCRALRKAGLIRESIQELEVYIQSGGDSRRAERERVLARASSGEASHLMSELADLLVNQEGDGDEVCAAYVNGFLRTADYQHAFAMIEQWKQSYPQDPRPHYSNGKVQDHLNNWPVAEREYRSALEKQPSHYPSAYALARLLLTNNHPTEALPLYTLCSQMKYNAASLIGMAKCHRQNGDSDSARKLLLQAISKTPEERALSFQRIHESEEGDTARVALGSLELAAGNFPKALEHLNIALAANSRDLDVRYSRAVALRQSGQKEEGARELAATNQAREALAEADRIVDSIDQLKPQVPERLQIGEIFLRHGSLKSARFWIESALAQDSNNEKARQLLLELNTIEKSITQPSSTANP